MRTCSGLGFGFCFPTYVSAARRRWWPGSVPPAGGRSAVPSAHAFHSPKGCTGRGGRRPEGAGVQWVLSLLACSLPPSPCLFPEQTPRQDLRPQHVTPWAQRDGKSPSVGGENPGQGVVEGVGSQPEETSGRQGRGPLCTTPLVPPSLTLASTWEGLPLARSFSPWQGSL